MTPARAVVGFDVRRVDDHVEVDPLVDGVSLGDAMDLDLAGIWVVDEAGADRMSDRLLGRGSVWGRSGLAVLQVCGCGVEDDDLLAAEVVVSDDHVEWRDLQQQTEPPLTHAAVGPFSFDRVAYERAVGRAHDDVVALVGRDRSTRQDAGGA
ncbi:hypothetical protein [Solicola sp. PLA-1-18]|uniref:hypothetical protein n=1 Tax=Solicola sp. PLA-1-18 TaxID=3380532 RepID=UPI003B7B88C5